MTALQIHHLRKSFGGVHAIKDVSLTLMDNELLALIGPNGAGKTTLIKLVTGALRPDAGRVILNGQEVTARSADRRARMGLVMTHQIVRPFRNMTIKENVVAAATSRYFHNPLSALVGRPTRDEEARAVALLERVGIAAAADQLASQVPLGFLKRLQIARALAVGPNILMLDEPLAGLNQGEAQRIADLIVELRQGGLTILLIEHNLGEVLRISERLAVLDNGALLAEGDPQQVMQRNDVRAAYLGSMVERA